MIVEPVSCKAVLDNNHCYTYEDGISDTQFVIAAKTIATEDGTADDRLQQIVGETHTAEDAQVMEHAAHTLEGIPR